MIATAQFTIIDFNDVNISTTEPTDKAVDMLWLDTSTTPNVLKRWNGSQWVLAGASNLGELDPDADQAIQNHESRITQAEEDIQLRVTTTTYNSGIAAITPHAIILSNDNQSFITDSAGATKTSITITTAVDCYKGTTRMAGTIGTPQLKNASGSLLSLTGVTLSKVNPTSSASGSVTMVIASGTNLGADSGYVDFTITVESNTYTKRLTWNKAKDGVDGEDSLSIMLLNENQSVVCGSGRTASSAQTITIPFTAYVGASRVACTISYGTLPSGITLGSNTAGTTSANGSLVLNVANAANLGGTTTAYDLGTIDLTITANSVAVVKKFSWSKAIAGATGSTGSTGTAARTYFVEPSISTIVKSEGGSYTPSTVTFSSYYKDGTSSSKTALGAYWKIDTTTDGTTWTQLSTKTDTTATAMAVPVSGTIKGIRATIYSDSTLTTTYDSQSVMVVSDGATGPQGIQGPTGANGQTLYTWVKYADTPTTGMSDTPTGKTYIGLAYNKTTATESSTYSDYSWSLIKGADGATGPKGADGTTTYTWVKYADDANGTNMSDSPTNKKYLGLAYNKTTATESTVATDYSWSPLYDNVQVGFRNLLLKSDFSNVTETATLSIDNGVATMTGAIGVANTFNLSFSDYALSNMRNQKITGSMWGFCTSAIVWGTTNAWIGAELTITYSDATKSYFDIWGSKTFPTVVSTTWIKKTSTYQVLDKDVTSAAITFIMRDASGTVQFKMPKWEIGNISTDFSLAPEDTDSIINSKANQSDLNNVNDVANNAQSAANAAQATADGKADQTALDDLSKTVDTHYTDLTQTSSKIQLSINDIQETITNQGTDVQTIKTYFDFQDTGLTIGKSDSPLNITISNSEMDFVDNGNIVAYVNGQKMYIDSLEVLSSMIVGVHKIEKYNSDITLVKWVGGN